MTPDQYCQDKCAKSGSSFYYSFLFLPEPQRKAIMALYAFCREVDDVVDETHDAQVAAKTLVWWRSEIEQCYGGNPQHPVARALQPVIPQFDLPKEHLLEIIDGMEMDLTRVRYANFDALERYCYHVAVAVGLLAARIFGLTDKKTLEYAYNLGMAFQLTNILRDVREDAEIDRIYLPEDELERFGVNAAELTQSQTTESMRGLFAHQAQRAQHYYRLAYETLPECDRYSQRSGLIMAAIYETTLNKIIKDGYRVLEQRTRLSSLHKIWLAWRTARREKRRARHAQSNH